jgi:hypothetical protein
VDLVHAALSRLGEELLDDGVADLLRRGELGLIGVARPDPFRVTLAEGEVVLRLRPTM